MQVEKCSTFFRLCYRITSGTKSEPPTMCLSSCSQANICLWFWNRVKKNTAE